MKCILLKRVFNKLIPAILTFILLLSGIIYMMNFSFFGAPNTRMASAQSVQPSWRTVRLFDEKGQPHPALVELFELTGVKLENQHHFDDIVKQAQNHWYQGGKERWLLERVVLEESKQKRIIGLLEQLGCMEPRHPRYTAEIKYDYVLVHGALAGPIKNRLSSVKQAYRQGVRFENLVFLTGARALLKGKEDEFIAMGLKTEADLFRHFYQEEAYCIPSKKAYTLIEAPLKQMVNSSGDTVISRPTTEDTLTLWLNEQRPQPGSKILAFSNQPYIRYQHAILERCLKQYCIDQGFDGTQFYIETVGAGSSVPEDRQAQAIAVYLDNLARCLFEMKRLSEITLRQHTIPQMRCA